MVPWWPSFICSNPYFLETMKLIKFIKHVPFLEVQLKPNGQMGTNSHPEWDSLFQSLSQHLWVNLSQMLLIKPLILWWKCLLLTHRKELQLLMLWNIHFLMVFLPMPLQWTLAWQILPRTRTSKMELQKQEEFWIVVVKCLEVEDSKLKVAKASYLESRQ